MNKTPLPQREYLDFLVRCAQLSIQDEWQNLEPTLKAHLKEAFEFQIEKAYQALGNVQEKIERESYLIFGDDAHCWNPEGEREQAYYRKLAELEAREKKYLMVIADLTEAIEALEGVCHE